MTRPAERGAVVGGRIVGGWALAAFLAGFLRAWHRPVLSDETLQLVRVGGAWIAGRLDVLAVPPAVVTHAGPGVLAVAFFTE